MDLSYPEHLDFSSIGAFNGDIYNNIKSYIWKNSNNFGENPFWEEIRKFRKENSQR